MQQFQNILKYSRIIQELSNDYLILYNIKFIIKY